MRILLSNLLVLPLLACSSTPKVPPAIPVGEIVCTSPVMVTHQQYENITWTPVWGFDATPYTDLGPSSNVNVPHSMWISVTYEGFRAVQRNFARALTQTEQLEAQIQYYRNCIEVANESRAKQFEVYKTSLHPDN